MFFSKQVIQVIQYQLTRIIIQDKLFTSIYVNGFIAASSTEGSARGGVALPGGGEMIIGQDQDCILGCFNSSQVNIYYY